MVVVVISVPDTALRLHVAHHASPVQLQVGHHGYRGKLQSYEGCTSCSLHLLYVDIRGGVLLLYILKEEYNIYYEGVYGTRTERYNSILEPIHVILRHFFVLH